MKNEKKIDTMRLTRRAALGGGIAVGLACLLPREILGASGTPNMSSFLGGNARFHATRPNLYAFAGASGETTIIALTWPRPSRDSGRDLDPITEARIHTSAVSRSISTTTGNMKAVGCEKNGCNAFTGTVRATTEAGESYLDAVVLEMPKSVAVGKPALEIWAELQSESGARQRIGSPFLSELIAQDDGLRDLYHASSPAVDLLMLRTEVEEAITVRASAAGHVSKPKQYSQRLTSALLPDFLRFDPSLPAGFTFASQNGRHPADSSDAVVSSLLTGSPSVSRAPVTADLKSDFPYFIPHPFGV